MQEASEAGEAGAAEEVGCRMMAATVAAAGRAAAAGVGWARAAGGGVAGGAPGMHTAAVMVAAATVAAMMAASEDRGQRRPVPVLERGQAPSLSSNTSRHLDLDLDLDSTRELLGLHGRSRCQEATAATGSSTNGAPAVCLACHLGGRSMRRHGKRCWRGLPRWP